MANKRGVPGLYIDADMSEGIRAMSLLSEFTSQISTKAHIRTVVDATHAVFAKKFDDHMTALAQVDPEHYFHVYEYSASGDGFRWVARGDQRYQLWSHTINRLGGDTGANISWRWLPAKHKNPTYRQRMRSTIGWDAIRELPTKEQNKLLKKSKGRTYTYVWKAPRLEHGLRSNIVARGKALFMPMPGGTVIFRKYAAAEWQWPGSTRGNFTEAWVTFWASVEGSFEQELGNQIEKDAETRLNAALRAGKKAPRSRGRTFSLNAVTNAAEAEAAGRQQAKAAARSHARSIKRIEAYRRNVL